MLFRHQTFTHKMALASWWRLLKLKHWQNLCKSFEGKNLQEKHRIIIRNQTSCVQVSAAGHSRMIQNSHRKVSSHSKWLLLLLNSIWCFNSEWQQFGAWSTRAVAQQRYTSTWTEASLPRFSSNPPKWDRTMDRWDLRPKSTMRSPQSSSQGSAVRQIYFNHIPLRDPKVFPS